MISSSSCRRRSRSSTLFGFFLAFHVLFSKTQAKCRTGCDLAFASYYITQGSNLTYISTVFAAQIPEILRYNPAVTNQDSIGADTRISVPFSCDCLNGDFLGHTFTYVTQPGDTYDKVASEPFANLTTEDWVHRVNVYDTTRVPDFAPINVTVNCSCGDRRVSRDYGLFTTFPLRPGEDLSFLASESGVSPELLEMYNPRSNFSAGTGLVFVPAKDQTGNFPPLKLKTGISGGVITGISVAGVAGALVLAFGLYVGVYRRRKVAEAPLLLTAFEDQIQNGHGSGNMLEKTSELVALVGAASLGPTGITVDKSVEFTYEELAKATNEFSLSNKIGEGGFGAVFYAELRGEKAAIKKMDMQASKEFLAELNVLTRVHHLNLVHLIGYCVEGALFLVYEFIENGNLSEHLRRSGREPLPWSTRVQIALDSARGLEYIHEHTVPVYIHRDIKSANILIDKNLRGKILG